MTLGSLLVTISYLTNLKSPGRLRRTEPRNHRVPAFLPRPFSIKASSV